MKRYIALLRGINVGKAKRVPMADLRALMEALGHAGVRTLLNSGNAVFDARAGTAASHAKKLRAAILEKTGVDCEVIVKTAADLAAAIAEHPLRRHAEDDARMQVMFVQEASTLAELKPLEAADWAPEAFAVGQHAAWMWCASGIIESRVAKAVGKVLKERGTARNWATVEKLQAMVAAEA
ncbi:DUF1697 domain-containing protein [Scleromatobacter humisilvae]|uniref:DUF1697 domain-containing protein n=1 Tax=Scleromatobacter humisilvae TaxID=2897159 RepID=A0A9X2BXC8_9BURK|nr:DUF1697 domain-containing protein [Scleromatobacter humisilvae]MCK9684438.1 DUF1697 domain-containing protein [Scleromatobacter humisilvae]